MRDPDAVDGEGEEETEGADAPEGGLAKDPPKRALPAGMTFLAPPAKGARSGDLLNYYLVESHNAVDRAEREGLIEADAEQQVKLMVIVLRA
jgi:hypothetical protein